MAWTIQDHIQRLGFKLKPEANNYLNKDGTAKEGYSLIPSQENPNPVYAYSKRNSQKGGGGKNVSLNVYKKDAAAPAPNPASVAAPAPTPKLTPIPTELSEEAATAIGSAKAYEKTLMTSDGSYAFGDNPNVIADFNKLSENNYANEIKPKMPNELEGPKTDTNAQNYADKYKLSIADQLVSDTARLNLVKNFNI
tara:strand:+ start:1012 stop:1596 length:585 start_codon:yes stop_codon:yes gene_type:complete